MIKNKIIVLGGGMVGSAIAQDLVRSNYSVTIADIDDSIVSFTQKNNIEYIKLNFSKSKQLIDVVKTFDLVVGAVPGFMGYDILKNIIEAQINIVDISFMPEDSTQLNDLAKKNNVIAITDAGVAPGLSNLIFGLMYKEYDYLDTAKCYVGGLPQVPQPPWLYKSVFSPIDVIEEYTRPARIIEKGNLVIKDAMSDIETVYFDNIGGLDAFNSDGLRSLLDLPIPNMVEKTLRYNGHIQKIIEMKNKGLFDPDKINETAKSLFNEWASNKEDYDQTIMRLEFIGQKNNNSICERYDLVDYYDKENSVSSMARTTGYTCTSIVKILLEEKFKKSGIYNLEYFGDNKLIVDTILNHLSDRNIKFNKKLI